MWCCSLTRMLRGLAVAAILCTISYGAAPPAATPEGDPGWCEIAAAEAGLPPVESAGLIRRVQEAGDPGNTVARWQMRYCVKQVSSPNSPFDHCDVDAEIQLTRSETGWQYGVSDKDGTTGNHSCKLNLTADEAARLFPKGESATVSEEVARACDYRPMHPLPPFLLASVEAPLGMKPDQLTPGRLRDVIASLDRLKATLLPWRTRVEGRACYVLETTDKVTMPLFRSDEETEAWRQANPKKWERCRQSGLGSVTDPSGMLGGECYAVTTNRIAVDPANGFRIVRWSMGRSCGGGGRERFHAFPMYDVVHSFNGRFGQAGIPDHVLVTQYRPVASGEDVRQVVQTRLTVEEFSSAPDAALFEIPASPGG